MKCNKKALGLLLASSVVLAVTACGSDSGKASAKVAEDGVITLRMNF